MWELYALWAWLPAFFVASRRRPPGRLLTGAVAFAAIGVAGLLRRGRRRAASPTASAAPRRPAARCSSAPHAAWPAPLAYAAPTAALLVRPGCVWGAAVIADSAQFSAAVTELAEPAYAGSALTLQLALGFALTIASIRLVPLAVDVVGWRYALLPLAAGPLAARSRCSGCAPCPPPGASRADTDDGTHAACASRR